MAEAAPSTEFRPLNVKDALSYLDRVKVTFADQAEVYDRFLTIMKDFKSQGIDTPGVIERVSTLFRGHPVLIQGFNTFLPPGYRIECTVSTPQDEGAITTITVTTPGGMTTRTQISAAGAPTHESSHPGGQPAGDNAREGSSAWTNDQELAKQKSRTSPPEDANRSDAPTTALRITNLPPVPPTASLSSQAAVVATPGAVSLLSSHLAPADGISPPPGTNGDAQAPRPPMEFNHAINYVNKIKNRFVRDPETYKAFLEILQTYQKEGKAIQEVYARVTTLFHAAPDLLDEFKQFLPDTSGDEATAPPPLALGGPFSGGQARPAAKRPANASAKKDEGSAKKPKPARGKLFEDKGKGKRVVKPDPKDARKNAPVDSYNDSAMVNDAYHHHPAPSYPQIYPQQQPQYPHPSSHPAYAYEPPPMPPPPQPVLPPRPQASSADIAFFSRVKNYISDVTTYHEFLKLLNLYTQEILDLTALVSRAFLFLGQEASLWKEFKEIVGWTEGKAVGDVGGRVDIEGGLRIIENVPSLDGPRRAKGDSGKGWKTSGPSYRQMPQSEISLNCSGRDALCWDVLNDDWVCFPSWASDEGFVAHRKNPYEEALHRSEEERHEYDYHIEANLRTIALLEPIATRIAIMEADERATFRLKPGLGNQSKSIYQRVIKKVYGKEQGSEVITVLHENPCVAVPIVLARLKQKDDEWKRALREWNRVWRDVDAKNFWRSLDHQAINLKANDKKNLSLKSLVAEIENLKREQGQRASADVAPPARTQYVFEMPDRDTLLDSVKLIFSYLDRMPTVSAAEKDRVETFLRNLLPLVFAMSSKEFALDFTTISGVGEDDVESMDGTSDAGNSTIDDSTEAGGLLTAPNRRGFGAKRTAGDLRKRALKNAGGPSDRPVRKVVEGRRSKVSSPAPTSRAASPVFSLAGAVDGDVSMAERSEMMDVETGSATDLDSSRLASPAMERSSTIGTPEPSTSAAAATRTTGQSALTADSLSFLLPDTVLPDLPELIHPVDDRPVNVDARRQWNFFANSNYYALLRLFQVVYSRLSQLKRVAAQLSNPPPDLPVALDGVPSLSLFSTMTSRRAPPVVTEHHYQKGLILCEKLFDGEVDQATFEETLRTYFAIDGHILFTVDKLLQGLVKTAQSCMTDSRSQDLLHLLTQDRAHPDRSSALQQISYRTQAESILGSDENLYRFEWIPESSRLSIQLVGRDSITMEDTNRIERDWADYLERFVLSENTAGVDVTGLQPFLKRNLRQAAPQGTSIYPSYLTVKSALQSKICMRSYRIFFVAGTEDLVSRSTPPTSSSDTTDRKSTTDAEKVEKFDKWMAERIIKLEEFAQKSAVGKQGGVGKPVVVAGSVAADVEPVDGSKAGETKVVDSVVVDPLAASGGGGAMTGV